MSSIESIPSVPSHHVHKDNEPLPGAKGAAPTVDYSASSIERAAENPNSFNPTGHTSADQFHSSNAAKGFEHTSHTAPGTQEPLNNSSFEKDATALSNHPNNTQHGASGAAAHGEKKVSAADKIIGKTEMLAGKVTKNAGLQEKGAARAEAGQK